eukprot:2270972-Amphidinium_carterae.1
MLEDIDRQALKFARLSEGFQRAPGQDWADFYQAAAISLRNELGNGALRWAPGFAGTCGFEMERPHLV